MTKGDRLFLLGLALAVLGVYGPSLGNPGAYDDVFVEGYVPRYAGAGKVLAAFLSPAPVPHPGSLVPDYAYRPLSEWSLVLGRLVFPGPAMGGLRLGNLLLHLASTILVFLMAGRMGPRGLAHWAAAFFAFHPLAVPAVAYVYQRSVLLAAFLSFLCLHEYLAGRRKVAWAAGLLAMTAKETAVTLPLLLAVVEGFGERKWRRWLPFAALPLLVLVQVLRHEPGATEPFHRPLDYLLLEMPVVAGYLRSAALPFPLHFLHDLRIPGAGSPARIPWGPVLLCGLLLAVLLLWIVYGSRRHVLPRLALALFLSPLALESTVFPLLDLAFPYRCYPGMLGAALLFAAAAVRVSPPAPVLALGLLAFGARCEALAWGDPSGLLIRDVRHAFHRDNVWAHYGWRLMELGHPAAARRMLEEGVRLPWKHAKTVAGYITAMVRLGETRSARACSDQALADYPADPLILRAAAEAADAEGDPGRLEGIAERVEALEFPGSWLALWTARRRFAQGRLEEAEAVLLKAFSASPEDDLIRGALEAVRSGLPRKSPSVGPPSGRS